MEGFTIEKKKVIWIIWATGKVKMRFDTTILQLSMRCVDLDGSWGLKTELKGKKH